jgi:hypothetical protein
MRGSIDGRAWRNVRLGILRFGGGAYPDEAMELWEPFLASLETLDILNLNIA